MIKLGKYDKEITMAFNYIEQLETTYYSPEEFSTLYQKLYEATIPDIDIENLCQKLSGLLILKNIGEIKTEIQRIIEFNNYDAGFLKLDTSVKMVEYLSMSIKHLAFSELSLNEKDFIDLAYNKQIKKNAYYGDIWYKRGRVGVCRDMGRKVVRFRKFHLMVLENREDALDNLIDLLNYCVFYIVLAEEEKNVSEKSQRTDC